MLSTKDAVLILVAGLLAIFALVAEVYFHANGLGFLISALGLILAIVVYAFVPNKSKAVSVSPSTPGTAAKGSPLKTPVFAPVPGPGEPGYDPDYDPDDDKYWRRYC